MSIPAEDFLAHHGVVGMKWGKHKAKSSSSSSSGPRKSKEELKSLDKAAKTAHREKVRNTQRREVDNSDNAIVKARNQLDKHGQDYQKAKTKYKTQRHEIGKVAAKQVVRDAQNKYYQTLNKASLQTSHEKHAQLMQDIGSTLSNAIFDSIPSRRL